MTAGAITKGERTQTEIVDAALRLFIAHGYHGTSMRQIAQEAGIALSGIYNHFASKEDIFLAVFLGRLPYHTIYGKINAIEGGSLEENIRAAAGYMVSELGASPDFLNLMFIELVEFNARHIPQVFQDIYPNLLIFIQRFLANRPELRAIPHLVIVRAFIGLFFSYTITELIMAEHLPPEGRENALNYFVDIYLHGILKDGAAKEDAAPEES